MDRQTRDLLDLLKGIGERLERRPHDLKLRAALLDAIQSLSSLALARYLPIHIRAAAREVATDAERLAHMAEASERMTPTDRQRFRPAAKRLSESVEKLSTTIDRGRA